MIAAHGMAAASVARSFAAPTLRSPCCCLDGARPQDVSLVKRLVQEHLRYTGSEVARRDHSRHLAAKRNILAVGESEFELCEPDGAGPTQDSESRRRVVSG